MCDVRTGSCGLWTIGLFVLVVAHRGFILLGETQHPGSARGGSTAAEDDPARKPRKLRPEEKQRDYAVIESALLDLTDPKSPINKSSAGSKGRVKKYIILFPETATDAARLLDRETLARFRGESKGEEISEEIGEDLRRRNGASPASLEDFKTREPVVRVQDVSADLEDGTHVDVGRQFWKKHPDSWGCVDAFLPGYSNDGRTAVVVFNTAPSVHWSQVAYLLVKTEGGWKVKWRCRYWGV